VLALSRQFGLCLNSVLRRTVVSRFFDANPTSDIIPLPTYPIHSVSMILRVVFAALTGALAVALGLGAATATTAVSPMSAMTKQMHADKCDRDQDPNPIL
jgi:hypothetical protein